MRCVMCKEGKLRRAALKLERNVAGHRFTTTVKGQACPICKEVYINGPDAERFELNVARALAEAAVTSGEAVKFMRKAAGMRAIDLAELLGVVPETVSRWETDRTVIDRSALAVVAMLVLDRANGTSRTEDTLRALAEPKRLAKRVALKVA